MINAVRNFAFLLFLIFLSFPLSAFNVPFDIQTFTFKGLEAKDEILKNYTAIYESKQSSGDVMVSNHSKLINRNQDTNKKGE